METPVINTLSLWLYRKVCAAYNRILMSEAVVIVVISIQAYVLSRPVVNVLYTHFTATNVCSYIPAMFAHGHTPKTFPTIITDILDQSP